MFTKPEDATARVAVHTLVFTAGDDDMKLALNGNEVYPFPVRAGETRGVGNMYVSSFKALTDGSLYYEALCSL